MTVLINMVMSEWYFTKSLSVISRKERQVGIRWYRERTLRPRIFRKWPHFWVAEKPVRSQTKVAEIKVDSFSANYEIKTEIKIALFSPKNFFISCVYFRPKKGSRQKQTCPTFLSLWSVSGNLTFFSKCSMTKWKFELEPELKWQDVWIRCC